MSDITKGTLKSGGLKLYQKISLLIISIVLIALLFDYLFISRQMGSLVSLRLGTNSQKIISVVGTSPTVRTALQEKPVNDTQINSFVSNLSEITGASIVIFDANQNLVFVHNPTNSSLLQNVDLSNGNLSAMRRLPMNIFKQNKAEPLLNERNETIGYILVGFPDDINQQLSKDAIDIIVVASIIALAIGVLGAVFLANQIKKTLFGHEPATIATLLQEREALLDAVNDGVFAVDSNLNLYMINAKGLRLLHKAGLDDKQDWKGKAFELIADDSIVKKALQDGIALRDIDFDIHGLKTMGEIVPIENNNKITGLLISVNETVNVQKMAEKLSGVTNYADALRAQTHEFMNKMHVISGLLATEHIGELKKYVKEIAATDVVEAENVNDKIRSPLLSAFLLGKKSRANELQIDFDITSESFCPADLDEKIDMHKIIVIVGNLLENAFDAVRFQEGEKLVNLEITLFDTLNIIVENNGPVIASEFKEKIFEKGFSTKDNGHGYGLALLKENLSALGGTIEVESDELNGTRFTVEIPIREVEEK